MTRTQGSAGEWTAIQDVTPRVPASSTRVVPAQAGDTLMTLAYRELGSVSRWKEVAILNPHIQYPLEPLTGDIRIPQ